MEILRQLLSEGSISMSNLTDQNSDDVFPEEELFELLQNVYLSNSLLPIPTLYELSNHGLEDRRVWINCNPGHVVGEETARSDELEGPATVIGTVTELVSGHKHDGYIPTSQWTLDGWEPTLKALMARKMDDILGGMTQGMGETILGDDQKLHYLKGPAVVIDAVTIVDPVG